MRLTQTPAYRKAFDEYLRHGTPIGLSLKADGRRTEARPTTHYIWRTQGDGRVRPSHQANEGKIFAWDDPPATGHPGEDYGCRCWAEPYVADVAEYMDISLSNVADTGAAWTSLDFVSHYVFGGGGAVLLRDTGHLEAVVEAYRDDAEERLKGQIAEKARESLGASFSDEFGTSYNMRGLAFSIGNTVIGGKFRRSSRDEGAALYVAGWLEFYLRDEFTDPADIHERFPGFRLGSLIDERGDLWFATPYEIRDTWAGGFRGLILKDRSKSKYR